MPSQMLRSDASFTASDSNYYRLRLHEARARREERPCSGTSRDYREWRRRECLRKCSDRTQVLRRLTRIITVSDYTKRELVEKKGLAPERVEIIANGVDVNAFANALPRVEALRLLGLSEADLIVGLVGRLH